MLHQVPESMGQGWRVITGFSNPTMHGQLIPGPRDRSEDPKVLLGTMEWEALGWAGGDIYHLQQSPPCTGQICREQCHLLCSMLLGVT